LIDGRIDAAVLVKVALDRSGAARRLAGFIASISSVGIGVVLVVIHYYLWVIASVPGWFLADIVAKRVASDRFRLEEVTASYDRSTTVRGIKAGKWVCLERDHKEECRRSRAINGRSAPDPEVTYNLVVSTYSLNGNQQVVSFSNGESVTWYPTGRVIASDCPQLRVQGDQVDQEISGTAEALADVVRLLYDSPHPLRQQSIVDQLGSGSEPSIIQAIEIAGWWNLISIDNVHDRTRSSAEGGSINDPLVSLTEAGEDWHRSAMAPAIRKTLRKDMSSSRDSGRSIHIETLSGNLFYAENDISGSPTTNIYQERSSDRQILSSLAALLELREIPWASPDLTDVRRVMEEALKQQNPRVSGLKKAINKLWGICEQVAIGVLSNGAWQVLQQHVR
jgi:hypothetical protein